MNKGNGRMLLVKKRDPLLDYMLFFDFYKTMHPSFVEYSWGIRGVFLGTRGAKMPPVSCRSTRYGQVRDMPLLRHTQEWNALAPAEQTRQQLHSPKLISLRHAVTNAQTIAVAGAHFRSVGWTTRLADRSNLV